MAHRFTGKTVVIAGAGGGQGRAGAILFAREGARLALCDVNANGLAETVAAVAAEIPDAEVLSRRVDMRSMAEIREFIEATTERFDPSNRPTASIRAFASPCFPGLDIWIERIRHGSSSMSM